VQLGQDLPEEASLTSSLKASNNPVSVIFNLWEVRSDRKNGWAPDGN